MGVNRIAEDELCLLLPRVKFSAEARERAQELLAGALCWPLVIEHAGRYEILPLVYDGLRTLSFPRVPDLVRAELKDILRVATVRSQLLARELARLLQVLGDAGVPVMPLKGTLQAEKLYGDPALRSCSDIDVLVSVENFVKSFHLIVSAGYMPDFSQPALFNCLVRYGKDCELTRTDRTSVYHLDLHCGLLFGGMLERKLLENVWEEAEPRALYGVPAFTMSADWEFLYVAVHAFRHGAPSLKWLVDLDRLCRRGTVDWDKVKQKAKLLGWEDPVGSILADCTSILGTPVSSVFGQTASPHEYRAERSDERRAPGEILSRQLRLLKTPARKISFLAVHFFIPSGEVCKSLPLSPSLFFIYYALQPLRIVFKILGWFIAAGLKSAWRTLCPPSSDRHLVAYLVPTGRFRQTIYAFGKKAHPPDISE